LGIAVALARELNPNKARTNDIFLNNILPNLAKVGIIPR